MTLMVKQVSVMRGGRKLVDNVSLQVATGEMLAIIGANGAGKSTLLNAVLNDPAADQGQVTFAGCEIADYPRQMRARRMAFLAQATVLTFPFAVREVIALGRSPHGSGRDVDRAIIMQAARAVDVEFLLDRSYTRLSGGEKQRVQLARVLAQIWRAEDAGDRLLLLDEPVASLDIGHQGLIMRTLARVAATGVAVVFVGHDISLAAAHADRMLALSGGTVAALGTPGEVVTEPLLKQLFDTPARVIAHPVTGTPVVLHE